MNRFVAALLLSVCFFTPSIDAQIIGDSGDCTNAGNYVGPSGIQGSSPFSSACLNQIHYLYMDEDTREYVSDHELFLILTFAGAKWDAMFAVMTGNVDVCKMINTMAICASAWYATTGVNPDDTSAPSTSVPDFWDLPKNLQREIWRSNKYALQFKTSETGMHAATIPLEVAAGYRWFDGTDETVDDTGMTKLFSADSFISYPGTGDIPVVVKIVRRTAFQDPNWDNPYWESIGRSDHPGRIDHDPNGGPFAILSEADQNDAWDLRGWPESRRKARFAAGDFRYIYNVYIVHAGLGTPPSWFSASSPGHDYIELNMFVHATRLGAGLDVGVDEHPYLFAGFVAEGEMPKHDPDTGKQYKRMDLPPIKMWPLFQPQYYYQIKGTAYFQVFTDPRDGTDVYYGDPTTTPVKVRTSPFCQNKIFKGQIFYFGPSDSELGNYGSD